MLKRSSSGDLILRPHPEVTNLTDYMDFIGRRRNRGIDEVFVPFVYVIVLLNVGGKIFQKNNAGFVIRKNVVKNSWLKKNLHLLKFASSMKGDQFDTLA